MPQKETDLIPRMIAYLRAHLHDTTRSPEIPLWHDPKAPDQLEGSLNIRWLSLACMLLFDPETAVPLCIAAYQREAAQGHRLQEEMTVSHDAWWLAAHYAIRTWMLKQTELTLPGMVALQQLNTFWCGAELALCREFYLPQIGVLCPAARFEGALVSSQRSVIAKWDGIVGDAHKQNLDGTFAFRLAPKRSANDLYCLELAYGLVAAGDDLGRSAAALPKLLYPIQVEKKADSIRAYWSPGHDVKDPVLYVAWPSPVISGDRVDGWVEQVKGLPKRKPAAGSTLPVAVTGSFKQIG